LYKNIILKKRNYVAVHGSKLEIGGKHENINCMFINSACPETTNLLSLSLFRFEA